MTASVILNTRIGVLCFLKIYRSTAAKYRTQHSQLDALNVTFFTGRRTLLSDSGLLTYSKRRRNNGGRGGRAGSEPGEDAGYRAHARVF